MKTTIFLLLCTLAFTAAKAQTLDLAGSWIMFEYAWITDQGTQKTTEDQIKAEGGATEYLFTHDGKCKLTSNMADESTSTETYEGTWKLEDNKLILQLQIGGQVADVVWNVDYKDNILNLSRSSPDGATKVINSFRKNL